MSTQARKLLVTSALPYANGPLHLGHLLEAVQADIWVRFQKLRGHHCLYICADDAHGTAIMLTAERQGITPEQQIANVQREHEQDFSDFLVEFDQYYTTHSPECQHYLELIYQRLSEQGYIAKRDIQQWYDPKKNCFLADRYIRGTCPRCAAVDQYGDHCEECSATYTPTDLAAPRSALSDATPVMRNAEHYFFTLPDFTEMLKTWTRQGHLQSQVANKLSEWLDSGLKEWDISRNAPYFGFNIPGETDKYFYVWMDAPIGYMASLQHYCEQNDLAFDDYWAVDSTAELYHFIGKDIIHFHGLFWPAVLHAAGYRTPSAIYAHGFLTVNGKKMSKSRGTFINARTYLQHLDAEYLRYYYAAKLSSAVDDIDLNFADFMQKVNTDLVGKVVNIASRSAAFIQRGSEGVLADHLDQPDLWEQAVSAGDVIAEAYEAREYNKAVRHIMALADAANAYFDHAKPWVLAKETGQEEKVIAVCSQCINLFRLLMLYLQPILPATAAKAATFLNDELRWDIALKPLLSHRINPFKPLMTRIERDKVEAIEAASQAED